MRNDLRERVARVMAREFHGDEKDWREFQQEAKAVLAELAAELSPQPQAVTESYPTPKVCAEDVALVEIAMRAACDELMGRPHMAAWKRLKGLLGVGHG